MLACILAYPLLVHLSIILDRPALAGVALVALYAGFAFKPLRAGRVGAWAGLAAAAVASTLIVRQGAGLYALYLPPIVLPAAMFAWWAPTLRRGRTPFVTRVAAAMRGPLPPDYAAYTRGVTLLWVCVFALLTGVGAGFALWASPELWSLVTNFLNTALVGCVFLGEYLVRRVRLRRYPHPGFVTFIRELSRAGIRPGS